MNNDLIDEMINFIREEPKQFDIKLWFTKTLFRVPTNSTTQDKTVIPNCGTAGCYAALAIALYEDQKLSECRSDYCNFNSEGDVEGKAIRYLQITVSQAERLFRIRYWPDRYRKAYEFASKRRWWKVRAKAGINRLKYFQRTGL